MTTYRASQATVTDQGLNQAFREGTGTNDQIWHVWCLLDGENESEWVLYGAARNADGVVYLVREILSAMRTEIQILPVGDEEEDQDDESEVIEAEVVDDDDGQ